MRVWAIAGLLAAIYFGAALATVRGHTLEVVDAQEQIHEGVKHFQRPATLLEPDYVGRKQLTATLFLGILHQFFGMEPFAYHAALLALHGLIFLLVICLARSLNLENLASAMAGIFFLVLGIHHQAVTWVGNTTRIVMTLFLLAAFLSFIRYRKTGRKIDLALGWLSWLLALQGSPDAVTLPVLLVGYDQFILRKNLLSRENRRLLMGHLVMILFAVLYVLGLFVFYGGLQYVSAVRHGNFQWMKRFAGIVWTLANLFIPRREILQSFVEPSGFIRVSIPFVFLAPLLVFLGRRLPLFLKDPSFKFLSLFCLWWFVVAFLPYSVLERPFGWQEFPPARYFYVPMIGMSLWVGRVTETLWKGLRGIARGWTLAAVLYFYLLNVWTFCLMSDKLNQAWSR